MKGNPNSAGWDEGDTNRIVTARTGIAPLNSHPTDFIASPISLTFFSLSDSTRAQEGGVSPQHPLQRALFILHLEGKEEKAEQTCLSRNLLHKCQLSAIDCKRSRRAVFIS